MAVVGCKVGVIIWRMLICALKIWWMEYRYLGYLMVMEVMYIYQLGQEVALYAKKYLPDILKGTASFKAKNFKQALIDSFLIIDQKLDSPEGRKELKECLMLGPRKTYSTEEGVDLNLIPNIMGCTACVALITPTQIFVANAGDSRAVISKKSHALDMSVDHKPSIEKERKRIELAGGFIDDGRVNGSLNLSRCLGDLEYKKNKKFKQEEQMITCFPEVRIEKLSTDIDFLVIACDGIWDCLSSQEAVDYLKEKVKNPEKIPKVSTIVETMLDAILAKDVESSDGIGCDNMTCIVICFKPGK